MEMRKQDKKEESQIPDNASEIEINLYIYTYCLGRIQVVPLSIVRNN